MAKRALLSTIFLAALALPGTAGHSEESDAKPILQPTFEQHFADFAELPPAPEPGPRVVDLETFEPPVEVEPTGMPLGTGVASYYGKRFHGRRTANGERFDMHAMTAAHKTLPFGTRVRVTNQRPVGHRSHQRPRTVHAWPHDRPQPRRSRGNRHRSPRTRLGRDRTA